MYQAFDSACIAAALSPTDPNLANPSICPFCSTSSLTIQRNPINGEEWQHCGHCNKSGSPLAMASGYLGVPVQDVIDRLNTKLDAKLPQKDIAEYVQNEQKHLEVVELWRKSQLRLVAPTPEHTAIARDLQWVNRDCYDGSRAFKSFSKLFGYAYTSEIRKLFKVRLSNAGPACLLVPYFSGFDRIDGFNVVTANYTVFVSTKDDGSASGGLGFYSHIYPHLNGLAILSTQQDLLGAVHVQNSRKGLRPLPLMSWLNEPNTPHNCYWSCLFGNRTIFWESSLSVGLLHRALMQKAQISLQIGGATPAALCKYGTEGLRNILRSAKDPVDALKHWRFRASEYDALAMLRDAETYPQDTFNMVMKYMRPRLGAKELQPVVMLDDKTSGENRRIGLTEVDHSTYDTRGMLRFPGLLRITRVLKGKPGELWYVGSIAIPGKKMEFKVLKDELRGSWFHSFLRQQQPTRMEEYDRIREGEDLDSVTLLTFALSRSVPTFDSVTSSLGWDGEAFQFCRLRIRDGEAAPSPAYMFAGKDVGPNMSYVTATPRIRSLMNRDDPGMQAYWGLATAMCAVATAPLVELQPLPVLLSVGGYSEELLELYSELRLPRHSGPNWEHNWFRRSTARKGYRFRIAPVWSITPAFEVMSIAVDSTPGYMIDVSKLPSGKLPHIKVNHLVLQYLKYISGVKFKFNGSWKAWHAFTVTNMNKCFKFVTSDSFKHRTKLVSLRET